jgi:hypothetical protein
MTEAMVNSVACWLLRWFGPRRTRRMNTDSSINVVIFEVLMGGRREQLLGEAPTRAKDGIRRVWNKLAADFDVQPTAVRRVYSQWEPTPEDRAFIAAEFSFAGKVSSSFRRPPGCREWGQPTPEFAQEVEEFEKWRFAGEVEKAERGRSRSRRAWWQYWD